MHFENRRHTIKNYVLNKLKRYIKYNFVKLNFLKLRNKIFDRLRNRGFRKYTLSKLFSAVTYASSNKFFATSDTMYSAVVQESSHEASMEITTSPKVKVVAISKVYGPFSKKEKSKHDYSLGLVLPGECHELKKDIQSIFEEGKEKKLQKLNFFQRLLQLCKSISSVQN